MKLERPMVEPLIKFVLVVRSKLKSRARLEAENIILLQQVIVLSVKSASRVWLRNRDRIQNRREQLLQPDEDLPVDVSPILGGCIITGCIINTSGFGLTKNNHAYLEKLDAAEPSMRSAPAVPRTATTANLPGHR
jgi:hypothetical protein